MQPFIQKTTQQHGCVCTLTTIIKWILLTASDVQLI